MSIPEMARHVIAAIDPSIIRGEPFAFLGYSMGALLAFETAKQLSSLLVPRPPTYLFVCASSAPGLDRELIHMLDDKAFDNALKKYGGTSAEVIENEELMELVRPALRRDIKACEVYEVAAGFLLECPIDALGGADDADVPEKDLRAWSRFTTRFGQVQTFPGGHFFMEGRESEVSHYVISRLISVGLIDE
ncbi:hypothetical protein A6U97_27705 [Agrobacterium tumefaciens]|nr:hypothetical protein A6U97_27705 [Agrobacterium tumefaciens]